MLGRADIAIIDPSQQGRLLQAYKLVCLKGLSQQEAGERIGCSKQNVSQLLQKAVLKMKTMQSG